MPQIGIPAKRKPEPEDEYLERVKSRRLAKAVPHELNDHSVYEILQGSQKERVLDDCPEPDAVIPPLPLLYHEFKFGHFLDSTRRAANESGTFSNPDFNYHVDLLVDVTCQIDCEQGKQEEPLLQILFPGSGTWFGYDLDDQSLATTEAHILADHGGPLLIVEFKRQIEMAEPQLAASFLRLAIGAKIQICHGWRQPALGLIIRGEMRHPSRQVPLT